MAFYTDSLSEHIRGSVRAISGGELQNFRSHIYSRLDKNLQLSWRVASRDPVSNTWMVTDYDGWLGANEDGGVRDLRTKCDYGLCFFDALHRVGAFEAEHAGLDLHPVEELPAYIKIPHHRAQAEGIGIPYASDGSTPLPAINGMIAVPGAYNADALEIAEKSKGNVMALADKTPVLSHIVPARAPVHNLPATVGTQPVFNMLSLPNQTRIAKITDQVSAIVREQPVVMSDAVNEGFATDDARKLMIWNGINLGGGGAGTGMALAGFASGTVFLAAMGLVVGVFSAASYVPLFIESSVGSFHDARLPGLKFAQQRRALQKLAISFPEGSAERQDLQRFHDEILLGYRVLKASSAFNEAAGGNVLDRLRLDRALKKMNATCRDLGLDEQAINTFHSRISTDRYGLEREIRQHLKQRSETLDARLTREVILEREWGGQRAGKRPRVALAGGPQA